MDVRDDPLFLHRDKELAAVVRMLVRGKHVLVVGEKGVGKTRLMEESMAVLEGRRRIAGVPVKASCAGYVAVAGAAGRRILFIRHTAPFTEFLKGLAQALHERGLLRKGGMPVEGDWLQARKAMTGLGTMGTQQMVLDSLHTLAPPPVLFLDSLDRLTPVVQQFIEELLHEAVVCAGIVQLKTANQYRKIWASFVRMDIEPFGKDQSRGLVVDLLRRYPVNVLDSRLYTHQIVKVAGGNPFQIRNLLWQSSRDRRIGLRDIRNLGRAEEGEYFNMGPIYILLASVLTLSKIFSFGTDNREFYIYFSALGFLVYLIFRVFRTFFLFRPQRSP